MTLSLLLLAATGIYIFFPSIGKLLLAVTGIYIFIYFPLNWLLKEIHISRFA